RKRSLMSIMSLSGIWFFQAVRTRFPLRIVAGMTRMGSFAIASIVQEKYPRINKSGELLFFW
ncbi:MAG: hypothetical protein K0B01_08870, partial [Syntrophobacterales bacterium]|nr:hypothetical protein [Syntrophobacterales bacterium]